MLKKAHKYSEEIEIKEPRIYLSGPITGVADYKENFKTVEEELKRKGYRNIVNPPELDNVIINGDYEEYMDACITLLDMCNLVILLPGWEKSAGANREYGYALGKRKEVVTYEDLIIEPCVERGK